MAITKTWDTSVSVDAERSKVTYEGLSTDSKPTTDVGTNDEFKELDTGKVYYYDGSAWQEGVGSGGGGSGSGTELIEITNLTPQGMTTFTCDSTMLTGEIASKLDTGINIIAKIDLRELGMSDVFYVPITEIDYMGGDEPVFAMGHYIFINNGTPTDYVLQVRSAPTGSPAYSAMLTVNTSS